MGAGIRPAPSLPFGYRTVAVTPDGIFPVVADFCPFPHIILVDVDAQAGALRNGHVPIPVFEYAAILDVIQNVIGRVVVDAEALLLDEGVVASRIHLKARRKRDRAERT